MDELDQKILTLLRQNARIPVKEIASHVSLTSPAVSSRIRRLEEQGIIAGYTVILKDPEKNSRIDALISVSIPPAEREAFLDLAQGDEQISQCFHVTGSHSFIVKVSCLDMEHLEHLITRFQQIGPTSTQIILSTPVKRTPIVPNLQ